MKELGKTQSGRFQGEPQGVTERKGEIPTDLEAKEKRNGNDDSLFQ